MLRKRKAPSGPVTVVRVPASPEIETDAPGSTAPEASVTVQSTFPVDACGQALTLAITRQAMTSNRLFICDGSPVVWDGPRDEAGSNRLDRRGAPHGARVDQSAG